MTKITYCPFCAQKISTPVFATNYSKVGLCPNCASHFDSEWIKMINSNDAARIIESRRPFGKYLVERAENDKPIVGIDNSTGDAWTEDFEETESCVRWLADDLA